MPYLRIFRKNKVVYEKSFGGDLNIALKNDHVWWACIDAGNSTWQTDDLTTDSSPASPSTETALHIWLSKTNNYIFRLVRWEWDIFLDGEKCKSGLYNYIVIYWSEIRLIYHDYIFVLLFDESEIEKGDKNILPEPIVDRENIDPKLFS